MMFKNLIRGWKAGREATQRRRRINRLRFRPCLETMEERCVPTATVTKNEFYEWRGGVAGHTTDPTYLNNWWDLYNLSTPSELPVQGDYVQFDGFSGTDCILNGQWTWGDIYVAHDTTFGNFGHKLEINNGCSLTLRQDLAPDTVEQTILGFPWTNFGASNLNNNTSYIIAQSLDNCAIQIDGNQTTPGGVGKLILYGGYFNCVDNMPFTTNDLFYNGDIVLNNGDQFIFGDSKDSAAHNARSFQDNIYIGYLADLVTGSAATFYDDSIPTLGINLSSSIYVSNSGDFEFDGAGTDGSITSDSSPCLFSNAGLVVRSKGGTDTVAMRMITNGTVSIQSSNELLFTGDRFGTYSYQQTGGKTIINYLATLDCGVGAHLGFNMTGGQLNFPGVNNAYKTYYLNGTVTITGGVINGPSGTAAYGAMVGSANWSITGNVTINLSADGTNSGNLTHDYFRIYTGSLTLGSSSGTQPTIHITLTTPPATGFTENYFVADGTLAWYSTLNWTFSGLGADTWVVDDTHGGLGIDYTHHP